MTRVTLFATWVAFYSFGFCAIIARAITGAMSNVDMFFVGAILTILGVLIIARDVVTLFEMIHDARETKP